MDNNEQSNSIIQIMNLGLFLKVLNKKRSLSNSLHKYLLILTKILDSEQQLDIFSLMQQVETQNFLKNQSKSQMFANKQNQCYQSKENSKNEQECQKLWIRQLKQIERQIKRKEYVLKIAQILLNKLYYFNQQQLQRIIEVILKEVLRKKQPKLTKFKKNFLSIFNRICSFTTIRLLFYLTQLCSEGHLVFGIKMNQIQMLFQMIIKCQFLIKSKSKFQQFITFLSIFLQNSPQQCLNNISYITATLKIISKKKQTYASIKPQEIALRQNLLKNYNIFVRSYSGNANLAFIHESLFSSVFSFLLENNDETVNKIINIIIKCRFNVNIAKIIIRRLEQKDKQKYNQVSKNQMDQTEQKLSNVNNHYQWKIIFTLLSKILNLYKVEYDLIKFNDPTAFVCRKIQNINEQNNFIAKPFLTMCQLRTIPSKQQKMIFSLVSKNKVSYSIMITQTDHNNHQKKDLQDFVCKLSVFEVRNGIFGKGKSKSFLWNFFDKNIIYVEVNSKGIKIFVNMQKQQNLQILIEENIQFEAILIGGSSRNTSIEQLYSWYYIPDCDFNKFQSSEEKTTKSVESQKIKIDKVLKVNLIRSLQIPNFNRDSLRINRILNKKQQLFENLTPSLNHSETIFFTQPSFISIVENLGDMDLFFLIMSHIIRKHGQLNNTRLLVEKIQIVMTFFKEFVKIKRVQKKNITKVQLKNRSSKVASLCWLASKQIKQNAASVINELSKFLVIRGILGKYEILGLLQIYCSFGFWKDLPYDQQLEFAFKIGQYFNHFIGLLQQQQKQMEYSKNSVQFYQKSGSIGDLINYCKMLIMQLLLFYKNYAQRQPKQQKLSQKFEIEENIAQNKFQFLRGQIFSIVTKFLRYLIKQAFNINQNNEKWQYKFQERISTILQFFKWLLLISIHIFNDEGSQSFQLIYMISLLLKSSTKFLFKKYLVSKQSNHCQQILKNENTIIMENRLLQNLYKPRQTSPQSQKTSPFIYDKISGITAIARDLLDKDPEFFSFHMNDKMYVLEPEPQFREFYSYQIVENVSDFIVYMQSLNPASYRHLIYRMPLKQYTQSLYYSILNIHLFDYCYKNQFDEQLINFDQNQLLILFYTLTSAQFNQIPLKQISFKNMIKYYISVNNSENNYDVPQKLIQELNKYQKQIIIQLLLEILNSNENENVKIIENTLGKIHCILLYKQNIFASDVLKITNKMLQKKYKHLDCLLLVFKVREIILLCQKFNIQNKIQLINQMCSNLGQIRQQVSNLKQNYLAQALQCDKPQSKIHKEIFIKNLYRNEQKLTNFKIENKKIQQNVKYQIHKDLQTLEAFAQFQLLPLLRLFSLKKLKTSKNFPNISYSELFPRKPPRKGSSLYQPPSNSRYKNQAYNTFYEIILQQRIRILEIQKIWEEARINNRYFWRIFFSQQDSYGLDSFTNNFKSPFLLIKESKKTQFEIPKMKNQKLVQKASIVSQKYELNSETQSSAPPSSVYEYASQIYQSKFEKQEYNDEFQIRKTKKKQNLRVWNQFRVFVIKVDKIYFGKLTVKAQQKLCLFQERYCSQNKYDNICANSNERRSHLDIQKNNLRFTIKLNSLCTIMKKKYLFQEGALQIYDGLENKTYFFFFQGYSKKRRDQFLNILKDQRFSFRKYDSLFMNPLNQLTPQQVVLKYHQQWQLGKITNYQYLMRINDCAGRTFNDLSQYYVFPWTIKQFKKETIDFNDPSNYRDLSKPMGATNDQRWNKILSRYTQNMKVNKRIHQKEQEKGKISKMDILTQPFLYGSFYSNPAIICNYLVRFNPFTVYHMKLQSMKFDQADRLFFSIQDQFNCSQNDLSDVKELIPQFYSFPQFLKNRCKYDLGTKQNKVNIDDKFIAEVNDVILPKWVRKNTNTAQQFIFKMREGLESQYVTRNIHYWIDLVFGVKNRKEQGIKNKNLFPSTVYEIDFSSLKQQAEQTQILMFYKQFGQNPKAIFKEPHLEYQGKISSNQFQNINIEEIALSGSKQSNISSKEQLTVNIQNIKSSKSQMGANMQQNYIRLVQPIQKNKGEIVLKRDEVYLVGKDGRLTVIRYENIQKNPTSRLKQFFGIQQDSKLKCKMRRNIIQLNKQNKSKIMAEQQNQKILSLVIMTLKNNLQDHKDCLLYLKNGIIYLRQIKQKLEFSQQKLLTNKHHCESIKKIKQYLIITQNTQIHVYTQTYFIQDSAKEQKKTRKNSDKTKQIQNYEKQQKNVYEIKIKFKSYQYQFYLHSTFSQHSMPIVCLETSENLSLTVSIDMSNRVFVLNLSSQIYVRYSFVLKELFLSQQIQKLLIHDMGLILIFTQMNQVLVYNLMGDLILKNYIKIQDQKITEIKFLSQQKGIVLFGTSLGNLYVCDIFDLNTKQLVVFEKKIQKNMQTKFKLIQVCKSEIIKIKSQSIGRHWQIIIYTLDDKIYTVRSQYFSQMKNQCFQQ